MLSSFQAQTMVSLGFLGLLAQCFLLLSDKIWGKGVLVATLKKPFLKRAFGLGLFFSLYPTAMLYGLKLKSVNSLNEGLLQVALGS